MKHLTDNSAEINHCLRRLWNGDVTARQDLIRLSQARLLRLAETMLREFPRVRRWEDSDDVFQILVIRRCRTLDRCVPDSTAVFFQIAARELCQTRAQ